MPGNPGQGLSETSGNSVARDSENAPRHGTRCSTARCLHTRPTQGCTGLKWIRVNDPSAGSPTETLLRLLLPLGDKVH